MNLEKKTSGGTIFAQKFPAAATNFLLFMFIQV